MENVAGVTVPNLADSSFQEVSGLSAEIPLEEIVEGGENRFVHRLPKAVKYSNLVLKRGTVSLPTPLGQWVSATMGGYSVPIVTKSIMVTLLNNLGIPRMNWSLANAYPVKLDAGPLHSSENRLQIETLEFAYQYFEAMPISPI